MQLLQKQKQNDVPNTKLYSTTLRLTSDNINAKMKIRNRVLKALSGTTWGMDKKKITPQLCYSNLDLIFQRYTMAGTTDNAEQRLAYNPRMCKDI